MQQVTDMQLSHAADRFGAQAGIEEPGFAPVVFAPSLDWTRGAGPALQRLVQHRADELTRPTGLASNPLALAAFTDLFIHTALQGLAHSYSERLERGPHGPAPRHLRRAEQYLRTHADQPILMQHAAAATPRRTPPSGRSGSSGAERR